MSSLEPITILPRASCPWQHVTTASSKTIRVRVYLGLCSNQHSGAIRHLRSVGMTGETLVTLQVVA